MRLPFLNHRTVVAAVLCALLLVWLGFNAHAGAQGRRIPKRAGHINDSAGVVDAPTKQRLEKILDNLQQKTGIDFVVATVKTAGNEDLYDYSLRVASSWSAGPASREDSVLLVIASDSGNFLTHVSSTARAKVPDQVINETGKSLREQISSSVAYTTALLAGLKTFVDQLGAKNDFSFASLDPQGGDIQIAQRPRTITSSTNEPNENPQPTPSANPTPGEASTPQPSPETTTTPLTQPSESPALAGSSPSPSVAPTEAALPSPSVAPTQVAVASPSAAPTETPSATPSETAPQASPSASVQTVVINSRSTKPPGRASTTAASPEDEKEEVELTLTLPLPRRIETLKTFIATHPDSVALPRANELLVVAHAVYGDQKLQAGDNEGGLQQFRLAISDAPADMPDRLFTEIIARIPINLFFRGQRDAAFELARQAEAVAKPKARRLLSLAEFYLAIENGDEAARLSEAALQLEPDLAAGHQALAAARHISLRLDDAETEYARALALDPKSSSARIGLADLKRAGGKTEAALALYREQLQADSKSNPARAGMVLSLLELGKKDEAETELNAALQDKDQSRNLPLLVGAAYWFLAHNDPSRGLDLAQRAVAVEARYSWAQIALARATIADGKPLQAERGLRFVRQFGRFPTLDYELASVLASVGLYDEAVAELKRSFSIKNSEIETKLAGRQAAHAATFTELLAPERRAAIFQNTAADTEANADMLKGLLAFDAALNQSSVKEDDLVTLGQQFAKGNDAMRTYRQVYVAGKLLKKGAALSNVVDLMDQAINGVEAALSVPAATVAVQPEEIGVIR
ncbi:MAG TPA: TPM domain-containing protein, partial [Pyrinomonadaceae bacterium]|nr:TPM domain-containing protein [Pyrinomonadaceae bacterium]